ncbi:30S ribosomal protein S18, partial [termite gut metagenome]
MAYNSDKKPAYKSNKAYPSRRKECYFTKNKIEYIDYKNIELIRPFLSSSGKILPRSITGTCAYWQRQL